MKLLVIGGVNVDVNAKSEKLLISHDSNPGKIATSFGGVGFNIAMNMCQLGQNVSFLGGISTDGYGQQIRDYCQEKGLDISLSQSISAYPSSMYVSIEQPNGDMEMAVCDCRILEGMDLQAVCDILEEMDPQDIVLIDTNYSKDQIELLSANCKCPIYTDPISTTKARRLSGILDKITMLKPNRYEAEAISGLACSDEQGYLDNIRFFIQSGVKEIVISLSEEGLIACDGQKVYRVITEKLEAASTTGAGDSFMAGYLYGVLNGFGFKQRLLLGCSMAQIIITSNISLSENVDPELLLNTYQRVKATSRIQEYSL